MHVIPVLHLLLETLSRLMESFLEAVTLFAKLLPAE